MLIYFIKNKKYILWLLYDKFDLLIKPLIMPTNYYMFFLVALIPLIIGFVYYSPKVLGGPWMRVNGFTDADMEGGNMALTLGLSYLLSLFAAFLLSGIVIHQAGVVQMMSPAIAEAGSAAQQQFNELMSQYGTNHRNFGHGFLHGGFLTVFLILPIIAINAMFERFLIIKT